MSSALKTSKAFKAVILANENSNTLYPFHEEPAPGLLPILTKPILEYQFELLQRSGFDQCTIICCDEDEKALEEFSTSFCNSTDKSFNVRIISTNTREQIPAADALRMVTTMKGRVKDKITLDCDFLIIPADFFSTESLTKLLAYHHYKRATMTMMMVQPPPQQPAPVKDDKKGKDGKKVDDKKKGGKPETKGQPPGKKLIDPRLEPAENPLYVGIDADDGRVCVLREVDPDVDFEIHKSILQQVTSFTLHTNLRSPSVYVFAREALQLLHDYGDIESLDVLAQFLVGMQFAQDDDATDSHPLPEPLSLEPMTSFSRNPTASFYYKSGPRDENESAAVDSVATSSDLIYDDITSTTAESFKTAKEDKTGTQRPKFSIDRLTCYAFIPPPTALTLRADTITAYNFLNKQLAQPEETLPKEWLQLNRPMNNLQEIQDRLARDARENRMAAAEAAPAETPEPEQGAKGKAAKAKAAKGQPQQPRTTLTGGWFAEGAVPEQGVMIINSIVGRHCRIEKNAVVKDSILMDYVTIREGAKVESCIIGPDAVIEAGAEIKDNEVAARESITKKQ